MSMIPQDGVFRLLGTVQHYAWGGRSFIPTLLGFQAQPGVTYAEYWMGAHEGAPSAILGRNDVAIPLDSVIRERPAMVLGPRVAQEYGRMPFLFKVLDVREMLSIQVHPTKPEAELGFAKENDLGIPLDSPRRNYRDDNHKPELEVALSDFWLLHGFQSEDKLRDTLEHTPEFRTLLPLLNKGGVPDLYKYVMKMPSDVVDSVLGLLAERVLERDARGELDKTSRDYWTAKSIGDRRAASYDRGIFSIYFLNLVHLLPGQALYQDAGVLHALLQGQALEVMANSDNTIRGGLTPKHIDVPELLRLVSFKETSPEVIECSVNSNPTESFYSTPAREFCMSRIQLGKGDSYKNTAYSVEVLLSLGGDIVVEASGKEMLLKRGESAIAFASQNYRMNAGSDGGLVFKASIPRPQQTR